MKIPALLLTTFVVALWACGNKEFFDVVVPIDVPAHESRLAVTAPFAAGDSTLRVYVSYSVGILDNEDPKPVDNATVTIYQNGQLLGNALYEINDLYLLHLGQPLPATQDEYRLVVSAPGYDTVSSTQVMPLPVPIDTTWYKVEGAIDAFGNKVDELAVVFNDPVGVRNYYSVEAWVVFNDKYSEELSLQALDPLAEEGINGLVLKDVTFDGKRYEWRLTVNRFFDLDNAKIYVRLSSITSDAYLYQRSVYLSDVTLGNPFAEPVIVHSNVLNGYGIFSLESSEVSEVDVQ